VIVTWPFALPVIVAVKAFAEAEYGDFLSSELAV
jgi:hypothetical protein